MTFRQFLSSLGYGVLAGLAIGVVLGVASAAIWPPAAHAQPAGIPANPGVTTNDLVCVSVCVQGTESAWIAPDGRTVDQLVADHVLPDPATTPGVLNPDVTPATIASTICVHGWTATVRPPTSFTDKLRNASTPAGRKPLDGELDHLISIEDGGAPADPQNLWWMVYDDVYGARVKDVLETHVSRAVCAGKMTLDEARAALSPNWLIGYQTYVGPLPTAKGR